MIHFITQQISCHKTYLFLLLHLLVVVVLFLSYLDPPFGAGVMPSPSDSNRIITQNGQYLPLADQGNDGLKMFLNNIPPYHGTSPQAVRLWYHYFTVHASTYGCYVHP